MENQAHDTHRTNTPWLDGICLGFLCCEDLITQSPVSQLICSDFPLLQDSVWIDCMFPDIHPFILIIQFVGI